MIHPYLVELNEMRTALLAMARQSADPMMRSVGHGAGTRQRLVCWLRMLAEIGTTLGATIHGLLSQTAVPPGVDLGRAQMLVDRGMNWVRALQARLAAVAAYGVAAQGRAAAAARPAGLPDRPRGAATRKREPVAYTCIADKTDAEVFVQICADLSAAAELLRATDLARQVAAIGAAAQTMWDEPAAEAAGTASPAPHADWASDRMAASAAAAAPTPDSG
jgi:hypothetical protein